MRIDFSEPECSNCFHCRTLATLNTQESEPSNVISSSITSIPVSSGPAQALEHDSAAAGSSSTSSPIQALSHDSAAVGSTSKSSPVQAISHGSAAVGSTSKSSPVQALGHDSAAVGSTSTSSPIQALSHVSAPVGSTSTSSPVQTLGHGDSAATGSISTFSFGFGFGSQCPSAPLDLTSFRSDASGAPTVQATSGSRASATSTPSTSSPFQSSSPNIFGVAPAVTSLSSAPTQAFGQTTLAFGSSPNRFEFAPAITSVSTAPTQTFGQTTFGFGSSPLGFSPAITSVSSAPTEAFGPKTCCSNAFATQPRLGSMQAPTQATSSFGAFSGTIPSMFGSMQAPVQATFSSGASGASTSSSFLPFGCVPAPPTHGSSLFGPAQNLPWTTNSLSTGGSVDWVRSDGVLPATFSFNLFGQNPTIPTEVFGATPGSVTWPAQDYPRTGVNRFALRSSPSNLFGQNILPTGSFPGFPGFGVYYLPGSNSNPYGPNPYTTGGGSIFGGPVTPSPQPFGFNAATTPLPTSSFSSPAGENGGMCISISASKSHQHKSHEELRWEDYKQGNKGSTTNTVFGTPPMVSPSMFASPSVPDHPQRTTFRTPQETFTGPVFGFHQHNPAFTGFGTQYPSYYPISSSVPRPHETAAVSSPASGCKACGATTSTSASGYSTFNGATLAPPSATITNLPGLFYPTYGSVPMMFGTTPAAQVITPVLQAYPFNGYIVQTYPFNG